MKISFATKWLVPWNGTCQICVRLAEGLLNQGHEVSIVTNDGETETDWFSSEIDVVTKPRRPIQGYRIIKSHLQEFEPDIIHSHDNLGFYFESFSIPHVVTSHSNWPRSWFLSAEHFVEGFALELPHDVLLRAATEAVAVSDYSQQQLQKRRIDSSRVYNGVKIPELDSEPSHQASDSPSFLFVGRVGPRKAKYLPDIWRKIRSEDESATLKIIGYPADDSLSSELKDSQGVSFLGNVDSLCKYYSEADTLLFPSRAEACPLTVLEAQSYGCPVVAFDICSHQELINADATGAVVPAYETDEFATEALRWASGQTKHTTEACRDWIADNYSNEQMIQDYIELYRELLA